MASLRQQLEELSNPTPALPDLEEDDDFDGTSSRKIFTKTGDEDETETGVRRIRQAITLEEMDKKYQGSRSSRSEIFGDRSDFSLNHLKATLGDSDDDEDDEEEEEEELNDEDDDLAEDDEEDDGVDGDQTVNFDQSPTGSDQDDEDEEAENDDDMADEEAENDDAEGDEEVSEEENGIRIMNEVDPSISKKGDAVRTQLAIWDRVMHLTIKSHASLRCFNQLPRLETANSLINSADAETRENLQKVRKNMTESMALFQEIQQIMTNGKKADKGSEDEQMDTSDEDIEDDISEATNPKATLDSEVFDDDDFYQALLKQFIEQKSVDTTDSVSMSRQFLELQKLRRRNSKKVVDRRASKGRKIRYITVPKMVNFCAARPETVTWSHEKRNEFFKSLFQ